MGTGGMTGSPASETHSSEGSHSGDGHTAADQSAAVRRDFWPYLKATLARLPFADDVVAAYYCALDDKTPSSVRLTLLSALAYFLLPTDIVPDFIMGAGFTDDAAVLAAALKVVSDHILPEHRAAASAKLGELRATGTGPDGVSGHDTA